MVCPQLIKYVLKKYMAYLNEHFNIKPVIGVTVRATVLKLDQHFLMLQNWILSALLYKLLKLISAATDAPQWVGRLLLITFFCLYAFLIEQRSRWWPCRWRSVCGSAMWWRPCSLSPPPQCTMLAASSERGFPRPRLDKVRLLLLWGLVQVCGVFFIYLFGGAVGMDTDSVPNKSELELCFIHYLILKGEAMA